MALHQRGLLTLHAGAIAINGRAVAIAGSKGAGKSTLVAALAARGHLFLSDDVVPLDVGEDGPPRARVGAPSVNLWPDSAAVTGCDPSLFSRISLGGRKLTGMLPAPQPAKPVPLAAVIVLSHDAEGCHLQKLPRLEAFTQLVGHSHAFRWIGSQPDLTEHLKQCQKVLQHLPVFRLGRGESLNTLSVLAERVEECMLVKASC